MYIPISTSYDRTGLRLGQPSGKPYKRPYDSGGIPIGEKDGPKLLTILAGPSPYQAYILQAMAIQGSTPPRNFFRIVTNVSSQVPEPLQHLFKASGGKMVAGTIDRWTRMIYMIEAPGLRNRTRLEYALHEGVHLFADPVVPAPGSCPRVCVGTFQRTYGNGFGEGGTQAITEAIMGEQGITPYYRGQAYEEFTKPVRRLIEIFSVDLFARAYFQGAIREFTAAMESRWGREWMRVAWYTTNREHKKALAAIEKLETDSFNRLQRRGPKGDFPSPSRSSGMA